MSVWNSTDFDPEHPRKCCFCGAIVDKWIENVPLGDLCINCAQLSMRILFQDIIEYHTGTHVSLLDIMHHGSKDVEGMRLPDGIKPNGKSDVHFVCKVSREEPKKAAMFDF